MGGDRYGRWEAVPPHVCCGEHMQLQSHRHTSHGQDKKHSSSEFTALAACCSVKDLVMLRSTTSAHSPAVSPGSASPAPGAALAPWGGQCSPDGL